VTGPSVGASRPYSFHPIYQQLARCPHLVGNARRELAERRQLLGLHQPILRGAQVVEGSREFFRSSLNFVEQSHVFDGDHGLVGKGCDQFNLLVSKRPQWFGASARVLHPDCLRAEGVPLKMFEDCRLVLRFRKSVIGISKHVGHMDHRSLKQGSARNGRAFRLDRNVFHVIHELRREAV